MSLTDDLYREIILEHFKNPRNHGRLDHPDLLAQGANPFCGDEMEITVSLQGERISEIRAQGKGCSISQSSASMMTEAVQGKSLEEAEKILRAFKASMLEGAPMNLPPELEDLESLEGVKKYPVRIKCAILSWNTLLEGIAAHRSGKETSTHVEGEEGARPDLSQQMAEGKKAAPEEAAAAQPPPAAATPRQEDVRNALKTVIDPELNMNVVDLGLIYGTEIQGESSVKVVYSLTSPGCPLGPLIKGQIQSALTRLPWVKEVQTELVWTPPWDPHTMASEETKMELGIW